jgi:hypothetical protein
MKHFNIKLIAAVLTLFIGFVAVSSCKKVSNAEATVTIVDSLGNPIKGATVELSQDSVVNPSTGVQADINQTEVTDIYGNAFFSFKWEAVLNVEVKKGSFKAIDYITLKQSETVDKTIVLK